MVVFYFDRKSRGAISLARMASEKGSIVVFEPSAASDPALLAEALEISHIVKIASDRQSGNEEILESKLPLLLIETLGGDGLRFKHRSSKGTGRWQKLPAMKGGTVLDTAGAGDWCTSGIISQLGSLGVCGLKSASVLQIRSSIEYGQALAAWSCCYNGARGGMYEMPKSKVLKTVHQILEGDATPKNPGSARGALFTSSQPIWCDCCLTDGVSP